MTFKVKNLICYCVFTSLSSIFEKKIINNTKQGLLRPKKTQHQANTKILYLQEWLCLCMQHNILFELLYHQCGGCVDTCDVCFSAVDVLTCVMYVSVRWMCWHVWCEMPSWARCSSNASSPWVTGCHWAPTFSSLFRGSSNTTFYCRWANFLKLPGIHTDLLDHLKWCFTEKMSLRTPSFWPIRRLNHLYIPGYAHMQCLT